MKINIERLQQAHIEKLGTIFQLTSVESWYKQPKFIEFWKEAVNGELAKMTDEERENGCLIVSNHSLPKKIKVSDHYEEQLIEKARLIDGASIYTPVGFVTEHLEVLYDNDIECKDVCDEIGVSYYRPTKSNVHPLFIDAMVDAFYDILGK